MTVNATSNELQDRFGKELQKTFYPFLVIALIAKREQPTSQEVWEALDLFSQGVLSSDFESHKRMLGRLEKSLGLLTVVGKHRDAKERRYELTARGRKLLEACKTDIVGPLTETLQELCE